MLFITLMTKCLIQSMRKRKNITKPLGSMAPQGRRLGDERLEVLVSPRSSGSAERTSSRRQELSSSRVSPRGKRGKSV